VEPNPAHRIQQLPWKSASVAKLFQNGAGVRKPFVGLERAKGFATPQTHPADYQQSMVFSNSDSIY
jgi:hypothetical protein